MTTEVAPVSSLTKSEMSQEHFRKLLTWFPMDDKWLRNAPETFWWKLTVWNFINQKLEEWNDPDIPPYVPSKEHWAFHLSEKRLLLVGGGERAGKSRSSSQELVGRIRPGAKQRYWLIGVDYEAAKAEFLYCVALFQALGALPMDEASLKKCVRERENQPSVMNLQGEFKGVEVATRSVASFTKIRSWSLDGALMCEAALCPEEAFKRIVGRVRSGREGWLIVSGTFEKQVGPWYANKWFEWQAEGARGASFSIPTWANLVLYPGGWDDPEIVALREENDEIRFSERHAGVPIPPQNRVFPSFNSREHAAMRYRYRPFLGYYRDDGEFELLRDDEGKIQAWPVELAIDPGNANYAVLALQRTTLPDGRPVVYVIDEFFGRNQATDEVIKEIRRAPWHAGINMNYAGAIDIAARQRQGNISVYQVWRNKGYRLRARHVPIEAQIDRLRGFLVDATTDDALPVRKRARLFINARCYRLLEEFLRYSYDEDKEVGEWRNPRDAYNHGVKALAYLLIDRYGMIGTTSRRRQLQVNFRSR